ncbi:MAG: AMIN domain-containing protein [Leptolyngbyaceae cyanobacterium RM1_405_57]|nr:AMIN domain-containing protein [Leptolyngbyaceae cyanobacterium RM1_405_57]
MKFLVIFTALAAQPVWAQSELPLDGSEIESPTDLENTGSQVTEVRLEPVEGSVNLILESNRPLQFRQTQAGKSLIVEIDGAQFADELADNPGGFRQENPVAGVAAVEVVQTATGVRATITGLDLAPSVTALPQSQGLALSLSVPTSTAEALERPTRRP